VVGPEVNLEKNKCMLVPCYQNADQYWDMNIANRSLENVSQFKYLGTTVTNQNLVQKEIEEIDFQSRKMRLTTMADLPRWPHDIPLSAKVGIKFFQQVAVAQLV
jgi:hypothetical protein